MATLSSSFGKKKLAKAASSAELTEMAKTGKKADINAAGELVLDTETKTLIDGATDPTILINDEAEFLRAKFYLKQIEDLRAQVEDLHAYVTDAFGTDSSNAAATGAKGDKGDTGAAGAKGDKGDTGAAGSNGSNGSNGAKGDKGDTGATGPQGATGAAGSNASVSGFEGSQVVVVDAKGSTKTLSFEDGLCKSIK